MKFKTLSFLLILLTLFFQACESKKENTNETKTENETQALEKQEEKSVSFKLKTTDNKDINITVEDGKIKIKEYANKVVLLNFFATWCPPCKAEIPSLIKLQNKYEEDFAVIAVLLERNKQNEEIINFIKEYKINYTLTNSDDNFSLSNKIGPVHNIPTMFLLDKNSSIYQKYVGLVPAEMLEIDIKKAIKVKAD